MSSSEQSRYEILLQRHLQPLRRLVWSYARDASESDDLLQEIALALWTALPRFRGDSSERTWLYRVAHNTALTYIAGRKRRTDRELKVTPPIEPVSAANPESEAIRRQQQDQLWNAIRELSVPDRQIVVLYLEGMTAAELEAVTGLSSGNIATRLTRIRQRIAGRLRGQEVRE
jgi:RNA polymerase sigma-70 factor (ECF subfamily)